MEKYKRGNFKWKNGIPDSEVVFIEDDNGRFLVSFDTNKKLIFK